MWKIDHAFNLEILCRFDRHLSVALFEYDPFENTEDVSGGILFDYTCLFDQVDKILTRTVHYGYLDVVEVDKTIVHATAAQS